MLLQSGYWCSVLGYGNPDLIEPVKSQINRLINVMSAFRPEEIIPDHDAVAATPDAAAAS